LKLNSTEDWKKQTITAQGVLGPLFIVSGRETAIVVEKERVYCGPVEKFKQPVTLFHC
jgi:hypothetical protein